MKTKVWKTFIYNVSLSAPHCFKGFYGEIGNEMCQGPLKEQRRTMNFNVAEYKMFIDLVSDSTLQLAFKITISCQILGSVKNSELPFFLLPSFLLQDFLLFFLLRRFLLQSLNKMNESDL